MDNLTINRVEISQRIKQLKVNDDIEAIQKEIKVIEKEKPKKTINKILSYLNELFIKMF
jgi:hypothetical protein